MNNLAKTVIIANDKKIRFGFSEVAKYRDLIKLLIKRNYSLLYKQTILGPAWLIINPLLTTLIFTVVFGRLAGISTGGAPPILFYMLGNIIWTFFSSTANDVSITFLENAETFKKVYFPRLTVPIATVCTKLINFFLQFALFCAFYAAYCIMGADVKITKLIWLAPIILIQIGLIAVGTGLIVTAVTAKYRDLKFIFPVILQLWMYVTPIVYSSSSLNGVIHTLVLLNPISPCVELMRAIILGSGEANWLFWTISWLITILLAVGGLILFKKTEKNFVDVI